MIEAWERPDTYTLTVTDLLDQLTDDREMTDSMYLGEAHMAEVDSMINAIRKWVSDWSARSGTT